MFEMFIMSFPIFWISGESLYGKRNNLHRRFLSWLLLGAVCFSLSLVMIWKLSALMGGAVLWPEVVYYGWFLFALFVIVRAVKHCLLNFLENICFLCFSKKVRLLLSRIVAFPILLILAVPFFLAETTIHRPKVSNVMNPQKTLGYRYSEVTLKTRDHLKIKAWYIPANSQKAVIIAHGLGANKSNFIGTVDLWHSLGFNVLIFDFRGHGNSDGHTVSFGYRERYDVLAGLEYLMNERKFLPSHIWGYGVSFWRSCHASCRE